MTNDQLTRLRIAIAMDQGWKYAYSGESKDLRYWRLPHFSPSEEIYQHQLPDYPNDRNAIIEVIAGLPEEKQFEYMSMLNNIVSLKENISINSIWQMLTATPAQLAEAYCKTKGLL